ncbi:MazG-like family protein [Kitasatospora viridis]|uniref:MazG-like nucleotide pyrophosphohydrolase family protein n=1 Tax=Kitasatospora viridis TaxID=281105 RepID=A0A561SA83_9ACTN|nr:MazG-like family protein [Kitasatospora viridis]TWF71757.1 hypothetical protein FHX73_18128 [Kitasatospora viridis]
MEQQTWDHIGDLVAWLDGKSTLPPETERLLRIMKIGEEVGEVHEAVSGVLGQNPRKGITHTWEDVKKEIGDTILTGMVALYTLAGPDAPKIFQEHLEGVAARARAIQ